MTATNAWRFVSESAIVSNERADEIEVPKRRAPKQTGGIANTGTIVAGGDIVGRDKIIHHHGPSEERLLALSAWSN
jgi:hypothetical protein